MFVVRWSFTLWVLAAWVLAAPVLAAPLSLVEAIERARVAAPTVRLASRMVDEAEASRVGQGVPFPSNPRLFGDFRPLAIELAGQPSEPRNGYLVGVDGLLEIGGAGFSRVAEAQKRVDLARAELSAEQTRAAARVWVVYLEALLADERVARFEASLALQRRIEAAARERVAMGSAGEPELTAVLVEVASVGVQLEEAKRLARTARLELAHTLDWPGDATLELAHASLEPVAAESESDLLARALNQRPELAAIRARLALLEQTDARLFREALPKMGYTLGLDTAPASPGFAFMGLSFELPVAQRNQGPRAVAAAQRTTEQVRLEAELRRVRREVAMARQNYESRRAQVSLLTDSALPNAQRTNALIEAGWRAGRFDVFRLTSTIRELQRVERERLETLLAAWSDYVELQRVSGALSGQIVSAVPPPVSGDAP